MTERPGHDTATDDSTTGDTAPGDKAPGDKAPGDKAPGGATTDSTATHPPARTRSTARPSPTSRARRTAAAAAQDGQRRPSPRPAPAPGSPAAAGPASPDTTATDADTAATTDAGQAAEGLDSLDGRPADLVSRQPAAAEAGRRVPVRLVALLAVAVLALAVLDGWLLTSRPGAGSKGQREQALSTAKTAVPLILSYDYRHFDPDVAAAKARLTGRAVTDYVQAMSTTIKPTATKVQAVVQAQTDGAGVEAVSDTGDQVTVVVFGEQKVTNTSLTAPRIDLFRVRVTLDRVQGQWLVSKFDQI
jgi:Mce-associated membrane protein